MCHSPLPWDLSLSASRHLVQNYVEIGFSYKFAPPPVVSKYRWLVRQGEVMARDARQPPKPSYVGRADQRASVPRLNGDMDMTRALGLAASLGRACDGSFTDHRRPHRHRACVSR